MSVLMDQSLSSGANTFSHPCGRAPRTGDTSHRECGQNHATCHSTLEGKCVCAHGPTPQLWCQHFFSSLWPCPNNMRHHAPKTCAEPCDLPKHWRASVSVLMDQSLSSGANTFFSSLWPCPKNRRHIPPRMWAEPCDLPLNIGGQVCLCSWTNASALVPTLFLILVAVPQQHATPRTENVCRTMRLATQHWRASVSVLMDQSLSSGANTFSHPCGRAPRSMRHHAPKTCAEPCDLPLNIGGQVCLCSWTKASALVPTLFLILVAVPQEQATHPTENVGRTMRLATQHWRASVSVLMDQRLSSGANTFSHPCGRAPTTCDTTHRKRVQNHATCHSTLEGKCVCAHGPKSQLWCQHFFSSLWPCPKKHATPRTENVCRTMRLATQHWRASVSVLMDQSLSSGANTFSHPCGRAPTTCDTTHRKRVQNHATCHSTLEGKCVCAHGPKPQLWCQHFFSSLWSCPKNHATPRSTKMCITMRLEPCDTTHHKNVGRTMRASVSVLMDQRLSSGANTSSYLVAVHTHQNSSLPVPRISVKSTSRCQVHMQAYNDRCAKA